MTTSDRIVSMRHKLGLKQTQAAAMAGISQQTWAKIEAGKIKESAKIIQMARVLGVTPEWLKFGDCATRVDPVGNRVPLISYVQAGSFHEVTSDGDYDYLITLEDVSASSFALRIEGESMAPEFLPGDTIIIDPLIQPKPGDYVVASNGDDEVTFKRYKQRGTDKEGRMIFDLVPNNENYPTYRSDVVPIKIIGTMVEHRRYRKKN